MTREEIVRVRVKGGGAASFAAGAKYALKLEGGQTSDKWDDGSPITRAEFEAVLPHEVFEIEATQKAEGRTQKPEVSKF